MAMKKFIIPVILTVATVFISAAFSGCFKPNNVHAEITKTDWSIESDGDTTWYVRVTVDGFSILNPTSSEVVEIKKPLKNYIDSLLSNGKVEGTVKSDEPDEAQIREMLRVKELPLEAQATLGLEGS